MLRSRLAVVISTTVLAAAPLLAGLADATALHAQEPPLVEQRGASDVALDRRIDRLLGANPLILVRDTLVPAGDTLRGPVLVLDATVILEGVVAGDLVLVDAGAFIRPDSRVEGDLVNIGGGLYRSELARVGGTIIDLPTASYEVVREPDRVPARILIVASDSPSPLQLDGFMGVLPPSYDRVNGVTAAWGARYYLPRLGDVMPSVHGQVGWQTERGEPTYAASGRVAWFASALEGGYFRGWDTNERWLRSDLRNALNHFWDGDDFRDYHEVDRYWGEARREFGDEEKSFYGVASLLGQVEDARSLPGGDPWTLWPADPRPNPAIDEGRTTSLIARWDMEWHGLQTDFEGRVEYEAAREWLDGDFAFDRASVQGDWAMHALADHTLEIEFFVQQPLGGGVLPRQEWSFLGGSGTLQTASFGRYAGDRVIFAETKYIVPFPERLALPLLGAPDLELIHAAGMAWIEGEDPAFRQELGGRLQFFGLYFRYMLDPAEPGNNDLDVGLSWPFDASYPWQRP